MNQDVPAAELEAPMPDAAEDLYYASGHWGQYIFIIPSRNVIIVRTGDDRDHSFDLNIFVPLALAVAEVA